MCGCGGVAGMVLEGQRLFIYVGLEVPNTAHVIKAFFFTCILDNVMKIPASWKCVNRGLIQDFL